MVKHSLKPHLKKLKEDSLMIDIKEETDKVKQVSIKTEQVKKTIQKKQIKKKTRIAINGFGRIGRMILRAGIDNPNVEFVCINNTHGVKDTAYFLKHDTSQGLFKYKINEKKDSIEIVKDGKNCEISVIGQRDISNINWTKYDVDVVMECTGHFTTNESAGKHILSGAKKVIISAPSKTDCFYFLRGVNDSKFIIYFIN